METILKRALTNVGIDPIDDQEWYKTSVIGVDLIIITILDAVTVTEEEVVHVVTCNPDGTDMKVRSTTYL